MKLPHKEFKFNITIDEINEFRPCYPAESKLGEKWSGNLIDILKAENIEPEDKLWAVSLFAGDKLNRLFAVHCARQALMLIENPDPRSVVACDVAEKFAKGEATKDELAAAWAAAWAAAGDVVRAAAGDAARAAAGDAARAAVRDVARAAELDAAWNAAWDAAWDAQIDFLIQMIEDVEK